MSMLWTVVRHARVTPLALRGEGESIVAGKTGERNGERDMVLSEENSRVVGVDGEERKRVIPEMGRNLTRTTHRLSGLLLRHNKNCNALHRTKCAHGTRRSNAIDFVLSIYR